MSLCRLGQGWVLGGSPLVYILFITYGLHIVWYGRKIVSILPESKCDSTYCPLNYAANCYYYEVKCHECRVNNYDDESLRLHYKPISNSLPIKDHPCRIAMEADKKAKRAIDREAKKNNQASKQGRELQRRGKQAEQRIVKSMPNASFTRGSGAICRDGDARVRINELSLGVEIKLRTNGKNTLGPTKAEWDKARSQGVSLFMVTSDNRTIITMTKHTLDEIIEEVELLREELYKARNGIEE